MLHNHSIYCKLDVLTVESWILMIQLTHFALFMHQDIEENLFCDYLILYQEAQ